MGHICHGHAFLSSLFWVTWSPHCQNIPHNLINFYTFLNSPVQHRKLSHNRCFLRKSQQRLCEGSKKNFCHGNKGFPFITRTIENIFTQAASQYIVLTVQERKLQQNTVKLATKIYWHRPPMALWYLYYMLQKESPKHHQGHQSSSPHTILTPAIWKMLPEH